MCVYIYMCICVCVYIYISNTNTKIISILELSQLLIGAGNTSPCDR